MDRESIKEAVHEAMDEYRKNFWVEPEEHYQQHQFLKKMMSWADKCTSTFWKTVVQCIVGAILTLIVIGYITWGAKNFKG